MMLPGYPDYYYQYVTGIKTGWHDQAGDCIVTTAKAEGYAYLCVAMGSPTWRAGPVPDNGAMIDSKALYRWAFRTFTLKSIVDMEKPLAEVNLNLAWEKDTLLLVPEKDVTALLPNDVDLNSIVVSEVEKPESVNAPITKGEILGKATLPTPITSSPPLTWLPARTYREAICCIIGRAQRISYLLPGFSEFAAYLYYSLSSI